MDWLRDQVKVSGTNGILVGLSGGIDSSVVANLIKRAFPENSLGVILPCKSHAKDKADGQAVAVAAGLEFVEVDLSSTHETLLASIQNAVKDLDTTNHQ